MTIAAVPADAIDAEVGVDLPGDAARTRAGRGRPAGRRDLGLVVPAADPGVLADERAFEEVHGLFFRWW